MCLSRNASGKPDGAGELQEESEELLKQSTEGIV